MAMMLPRSVFFHIPKTGGAWVRLATRNAGMLNREIGYGNATRNYQHNTIAECDVKDRFTFAFVRNPYSWYQSYWSFRVYRTGWYQHDFMDFNCHSDKFDTWIEQILNFCPGQLTQRYELYCGPKGKKSIDYIGRTEDLVNNLVYALKKSGETFNEGPLRATPKWNDTNNPKPKWSKELKQRIYEAEKEAFKRFGYEK